MSLPVVPLHKDVHGALKLNASRNLNEFATQHMFPVSVHEFVRAGAEFPVVFVKDAATGQFRSVILTGLMPNENIYAVANVLPTYLPLAVQNYPMVLIAEAQVENQFAIGINTNSPLVQTETGAALFTETGEETEYLVQRKQLLIRSYEQLQITDAFIQLLQQLDLLLAQSFTIEVNGEVANLNGIYIINEQKLNELSTEQFEDLRRRGFLPSIYSQLTSLHQLSRLASLKANLRQA
jgi:hypothetical protein